MLFDLEQTITIKHTLDCSDKQEAIKEFDKMIDSHVCDYFTEIEDDTDIKCINRIDLKKDRYIDFKYDEEKEINNYNTNEVES